MLLHVQRLEANPDEKKAIEAKQLRRAMPEALATHPSLNALFAGAEVGAMEQDLLELASELHVSDREILCRCQGTAAPWPGANDSSPPPTPSPHCAVTRPPNPSCVCMSCEVSRLSSWHRGSAYALAPAASQLCLCLSR